MSKREFLQLAHNYNSIKHGIGGWFASEKLDGMRAYWDGGFTRGTLTSQIPFANTLKDYRRIDPVRATGLWTRYAKPIAAPDWWLDALPNIPLDGELYIGPGEFQTVISTVKKFVPLDYEWKSICYMVFDIPSDYYMFAPGKINNPQWSATYEDMRHLPPQGRTKPISFRRILKILDTLGHTLADPIDQHQLPMQTQKAEEELEEILDGIMSTGGEGVMLRRPDSIWQPTRNYDLLKVKRYLNSEATVIGYTWGKGKLEGLMGSMTVSWKDDIIFELSGFTDAERKMTSYYNTGSYYDIESYFIPGEPTQKEFVNLSFPLQSTVTFKYRELTDDGIPKEARYWRK